MKNKWDVIFRIVFGIILVAMAVLLGITGYRYNNMSIALNKISNQLSYLEDSSKVIESNVDNLEAELSSILQEDASMIEDYSVRVTGCDFANGTYDVLITVVPREYTDTTVLVPMGEKERIEKEITEQTCGTAGMEWLDLVMYGEIDKEILLF